MLARMKNSSLYNWVPRTNVRCVLPKHLIGLPSGPIHLILGGSGASSGCTILKCRWPMQFIEAPVSKSAANSTFLSVNVMDTMGSAKCALRFIIHGVYSLI